VILYEVTTVLRNILLRSSGYPADMDSVFSTRYSACVSCFIHVNALFILIYNIVVSTRQASACKLRGDGKFTANFETVRNRKHVSVVYAVFANHIKLLGSTSVTAVSSPEWQRIPADYIATEPYFFGRGGGRLCCTTSLNTTRPSTIFYQLLLN
jgi:hypothetical protein